MEKLNWAKKIAALGTGALMLGATLTGALAVADLANYPAPFVMNGVLSDTVLVVGESAATADVLGAVDIAASLQAAATSPVAGGSAGVVTISEGTKVSQSGNKMNYNESISTLQTVFDKVELPTVLGDETLHGRKFTQTLTISTGTATFKYDSPGKVDKVEYGAGDYLYFPTNTKVYKYDLAMESTLNDAAADVEGKQLKIQGKTYTVSDIAYSTTGQWTEMTLLSGSATHNLVQDEPLGYGDSTVTLGSVNEAEDKCVINVDGVSKTLDVGDTETVNGLTVGVIGAFYSTNLKTCEVTLGADKLVLNNGGKVERNGLDIDGTSVNMVGNNTASTFNSLQINYTTDKDDFDNYMQYFAAGQAWADPVFNNWQILFQGTTAKTEEMKLERSADEATFTFKNKKGQEVNLEWFSNSSQSLLGDSSTGLLLWQAVATQNSTFNSTISVDTDTVADVKLWVVLEGGEVHILEFSEYDDDDNKVTFDDITSGNEVKTAALSATLGVLESVTFGSLGTFQLGFSESDGWLYFNATGNVAESELGAKINIVNATAITITSPNEDSDKQSADNVFRLQLSYDSTDTELDLYTPTKTSGTAFLTMSSNNKEYNDNDVSMYVTEKGALFEYDADKKSYATLTYPEEDVYANVFIAPVSATTSSSGSGSAEKVNPFSVGLAVLDTVAKNMDKNLIVVGGPCANIIAAELMNNPDNCAAGFEAGKGMIRFYDRGSKSALLVAGFSADDTKGAAYVLADYGNYALSGDEVEVVSTNLADLKVNTV
ncbi:MAG: hypothetical protein AABW92_00530 [Nanoarchaeota archaeon]